MWILIRKIQQKREKCPFHKIVDIKFQKMTSTKCGKFKLIIGPMMSGKTTALDREVKRLLFSEQAFLTIKWDKDDRYLEEKEKKEQVVTHDRTKIKGTIFACANLKDAIPIVEKVNAKFIVIDELHFFQDAAKICWHWRLEGRNIIATGLNGTSELKPWKSVSECIPLATNVHYLTSICSICKEFRANCSFFRHDAALKTKDVLVGGDTDYDARCADCFHKVTGGIYM